MTGAGDRSTMIAAINGALHDAMTGDDSIVMIGEEAVEGGIFGAARGLIEAFGDERVIDAPIDPVAVVAAATGMAMTGLRPVVELASGEALAAACDTLAHGAASLRWRTDGAFSAPLVIRAAVGGGACGGPHESDPAESAVCRIPGLVVATPSTPAEAAAMLRWGLGADDPVVILEPKALYHESADGADAAFAPGSSRRVRDGADAVVISWGAMTPVALEAAVAAEESDLDVAVLDLVSLAPLDEDAIVAAAHDAGRVVIVHEGPRTGGLGGEIAAIVAERAIESLAAPVLRVTGPDTPVSYGRDDVHRPDAMRVLRAIEQVVDF